MTAALVILAAVYFQIEGLGLGLPVLSKYQKSTAVFLELLNGGNIEYLTYSLSPLSWPMF